MTRCPYCRSTGAQIYYRGKQLCIECAWEYAALFDGFLSKKEQRRREYEKETTQKETDKDDAKFWKQLDFREDLDDRIPKDPQSMEERGI